ncbi:MAG: hypothetical protein QW289_03050 [Sulfolobales archaeon]
MLRKTLWVARVVFVNQLKSLWRAHEPRKPHRSPSFLLLVAQCAIALLLVINFTLAVRGRLGNLAENWLSLRPPEGELLSLAGDILSALLTTYLLTHYFKQERLVAVTPDFEFLLYQPLQPKELYAGIVIGLYAYFMVTFLPWWFIALVYTVPWLGFTVFYFFAYMMLADPALFTASSIARRSGHSSTVLSLAIAYIATGIVHSAVTTILDGWPRISPLLTYPVKGPYILALALCESVGYAGILILMASAVSTALLVIYTVGGSLNISDFTTSGEAYEVRLRQALSKSLKRGVLTDWPSTATAVRKVVLEFTVYNPRAVLRRYLPLLLSLITVGYVLRYVLSSYGPRLLSAGIFDYMAVLAYLLAPTVLGGFVGELLSNDLKYLWVIKVYLIDLDHFVKPLLIKFVIVYFAVSSAITGFLASYKLNPLIMLAPIVASPAIVLSVFTTICLSLVLAKRARYRGPSEDIYRQGITPALDPVKQLLLALVMGSGLITAAVTALIAELVDLGILTYWTTSVAASVSVGTSCFLIKFLSKPLAVFLAKTDLHF